jgi:hypothetical protein
MRKITPQEISFEDNTQGGRLWLHEWAAYRMKKLLTAKVAKESREGREESLGFTLNSLGSPGWQAFLCELRGGFADFAVKRFSEAGLRRVHLCVLITVAGSVIAGEILVRSQLRRL